jgi:hypothetical protein
LVCPASGNTIAQDRAKARNILFMAITPRGSDLD